MPQADVRPAGLAVLARPGSPVTLVFTFPAGHLAGRTWSASIGGTAVVPVIAGDVMTVALTGAETLALGTGRHTILLTETTGDDAVRIAGKLLLTESATDSPDQSVTVLVDNDVSVDVTLLVGGVSSAELTAAVADAVADLLDGAPAALDTLRELAAALNDDASFAATVTAALADRQPLDADLTALSGLGTTPFGRSLLALVDAAAGRAALDVPAVADVTALDGRLDTVETALPAKADLVGGVVPDVQIPASIARDSEVTAAIAALGDLATQAELDAVVAALPGTYVQQGDIVVSVADYAGADPTGVTSSQAAVDSALLALDALVIAKNIKGSTTGPGSEQWEGGTLYFPRGWWDCRVDLSGRSNVVVRGQGPSTVIYNSATDGSHGIYTDGVSHLNRLEVRDLMVIGNALSGDGIHFDKVDYPLIADVRSQENGRDGINIIGHGVVFADWEGVENRMVSRVFTQWNGRDGIHLEYGHEVLLDTIHSEENTRYGIYGFDVVDLHLSNFSIEDNVGKDGYFDSVRQLTISNGIFETDLYVNCFVTTKYSQRLSNVAIGGAFDYVTTGVVSQDQYLFLANVTCTDFRPAGVNPVIRASSCSLVMKSAAFHIMTASASRLWFQAGTTSVNRALTVDGCSTYVDANHSILFTAAEARVSINGGEQHCIGAVTLTIDGNGQTRSRLNLTGWNSRTFKLALVGVAIVNVGAGLMVGGGTVDISGTGLVTTVKGVTLANNLAFTVSDTRTGLVDLGGNHVDASSTLTLAGGTADTGPYMEIAEKDYPLPSGADAETIPRNTQMTSSVTLVSGRLHLAAIYLRAGQVINTITFMSAATAAVTPTNQWFALYDGALAKLAVTADDTTTAWAATTSKTLTLASPYTVLTSGLYYVGITVAAATPPNLAGSQITTAGSLLAPLLSGSSTTGLTNPASAPATAAALASPRNNLPYAYVS